MTSLVSVLVPTFNSERTIRWALSSLLAQTVGDWEAIVVDDGSTDGTFDAVSSIVDPRIRLVSSPTNKGRGAARQAALDESSGEFIAILDADDWWYPWKLERQLEVLREQSDVVAVCAGLAVVGKDGELVGARRPTTLQANEHRPALSSLWHLNIPFASVVTRHEAARTVGFLPALRRSEDRHFLARLMTLGPSCAMPELLYSYSEVQSLEGTAASSRYLWRAKADLELLSKFPVSGAADFTRSLLQFVIARSKEGLSLSPGLATSPGVPTPAEFIEFDRARRLVHQKAAHHQESEDRNSSANPENDSQVH